MNYTIAVHGSPYSSMSHQHALAFSHSCIAAGHQVARVFFYHEGVYGGLASQVTPQTEADVVSAWQNLAHDHNVELCICIANAIKRGVLDSTEAERYEKDQATLAQNFEIVGLGQLVDAMIESDRYIEFPA